MSNTGHRWIYRTHTPSIKKTEIFRVCVYYCCKTVNVGNYKTLEEAIEARDKFMEDNGIGEEVFKHNNRKENG